MRNVARGTLVVVLALAGCDGGGGRPFGGDGGAWDARKDAQATDGQVTPETGAPSGSGGSGGVLAATGGAPAATGGAPGAGGTGGLPVAGTGGMQATGGRPMGSSGGNSPPGTGGATLVSTGGGPAMGSGGQKSSTGGAPSSSGGAPAAGGAPPASGGMNGTGGAVNGTGGFMNSGGAPEATGGAPGSGGAGTGGMPATGGMPGSGGAPETGTVYYDTAPIPVCAFAPGGGTVPHPPAPSYIQVCPLTLPLGSGPGARYLDFSLYPGFPKIGWVRCAKCWNSMPVSPASPTPCLGRGGNVCDYKCSGGALDRTCNDPSGAFACVEDPWSGTSTGYCTNPVPMPKQMCVTNVTELCVADCSECN